MPFLRKEQYQCHHKDLQRDAIASFSTITPSPSPALRCISCIFSLSPSETKSSIHRYLLDCRPSPYSLLKSPLSVDFQAPSFISSSVNLQTEIQPLFSARSDHESKCFQCALFFYFFLTCDKIYTYFKVPR